MQNLGEELQEKIEYCHKLLDRLIEYTELKESDDKGGSIE